MSDGTPYTELPMQRIAERAEIARSTLYLYFPDKSQLLIALAEQATVGAFGAALTWWQSDHTDGPAGVEQAMRQMLSECRTHIYLMLALSELSAYDPDVAAYWLGRVGTFIDAVRDRLAREQRTGAIQSDLDPETTAHTLTWMVERTMTVHCRTRPESADEQLARSLARAIWLTVYGDTGRVPGPAT
ncbi:TetR/AcrR family transcriptional regulator [Nocardia sp. NPDC004068]|uniref:TetR/AcrR family transcriptional regulator n=1 Tax=Nocardia sp. NPDC004068 TaxID=3364303 RepID=UPI0036CFC81F